MILHILIGLHWIGQGMGMEIMHVLLMDLELIKLVRFYQKMSQTKRRSTKRRAQNVASTKDRRHKKSQHKTSRHKTSRHKMSRHKMSQS